MNLLRPTRPRLLAAALLVVLCADPVTAQAQAHDSPGGATWRRHSQKRTGTPQSYALEVRLGPYRPNIDDEFGGKGPYEQVFGDDRRWLLGVELDYQVLRIPYCGSIGPGVGWGYTRSKAKAKVSISGEDSAEDTSLWIMPMYAVGVLRVDVLANEFGIPLVPHLKAGLGYALWKVSDGEGTSNYTEADGSETAGKGRSYGWQVAVGAALQLDSLDRHGSQQLDNSVGINHTYFFLEWMHLKLDGFGADDQLHVGTSTWVAGLAFEF